MRTLRTAVVVALLLLIAGAGVATPERPAKPADTQFFEGKSPKSLLFVCPQTGDDATATGAEDRPFATLQAAAAKVKPGQGVRLKEGKHKSGQMVSGLRGTETEPIWIEGEPGTPAAFEGGSQGLHFSRCAYLVVRNISVADCSTNGINCDDGGDYGNETAAHHILFENVEIARIGNGGNQDGLKVSGIRNLWVRNCQFIRTSGSAIDHVGCHGVVIERCEFHGCGDNAVQCKGGSSNIEIRWSSFHNYGHRGVNIGGSTGDDYFRPPLNKDAENVEASDIRVLGNLFTGGETPFAFVGSVNCLAAHNTVIDPALWLLRILQERVTDDKFKFTPCCNNTVENNIFYFEGTRIRTHINIGANTEADTFKFASNLWFSRDDKGRSRPSLPVTESNGLYGKDPLFRDFAERNYTLQPASPARKAGKPQKYLPHDMAGRKFGDPPSIGAWE